MTKLTNYLQLMRFDKPIGWLLLMWPTLWACWIAGQGEPAWQLVWIFAAGVIVMRSAGCVINDFADRNIDPLVERTQMRPLAAGTVRPAEALGLFAALIVMALCLLALLPMRVWPWSVPAALLTVVYPFMKRFFQAPQLILGMAFSFGIPMAYVAFGQPFDTVFWCLVLANIIWVISYDTAYAMSDRADDLKIGVRSTAILFGKFDRYAIALLQLLFFALMLVIGQLLDLNGSYYMGLVLAAGLFGYQQALISNREPADCFRAFLNNGWLGGFIWFGLISAF
jgi:4-hydroxybenzoate polyprenyltransferase